MQMVMDGCPITSYQPALFRGSASDEQVSTFVHSMRPPEKKHTLKIKTAQLRNQSGPMQHLSVQIVARQ